MKKSNKGASAGFVDKVQIYMKNKMKTMSLLCKHAP
jgi:hypothetical protein